MLKGPKASIQLSENITPSCSESYKLLIHHLILAVAKLNKMLEEIIFKHVSTGGSKCASPLIFIVYK